ncbi:hypothetical protein NEHOM01_2187 [Nematocida homosporus]|uniref:uncharacterized protein n=1 Tax=Nematocida homosporus TaxID=1912981 RepID=UPI00221EDCAC|nr:uncharacterized protein NEHOM01_2187 [Nematocida homosporus]KAI5187451.1 hypothetical protein NEHOM01_2187 [Nematocida homosporus]
MQINIVQRVGMISAGLFGWAMGTLADYSKHLALDDRIEDRSVGPVNYNFMQRYIGAVDFDDISTRKSIRRLIQSLLLRCPTSQKEKSKKEAYIASHCITRNIVDPTMYDVDIQTYIVLFNWNACTERNLTEKTLLLTQVVSSIVVPTFQVYEIALNRGTKDYSLLLACLRVIKADSIVLNDDTPKLGWLANMAVDCCLINFHLALTSIKPPRIPSVGLTITLYFRTFLAIEIAHLICTFKGAFSITLNLVYFYNDAIEHKLRPKVVQTTLFDSTPVESKLTVLGILWDGGPQADLFLAYLMSRINGLICLCVDARSFTQLSKIDEPASSSQPDLCSPLEQNEQVPHSTKLSASESIKQDINTLLENITYFQVTIGATPSRSVYMTYSTLHLSIQCFNLIYAKSPTTLLILDGLTSVEGSPRKISALLQMNRCDFTCIYLFRTTDQFIDSFIKSISIATTLRICIGDPTINSDPYSILTTLKYNNNPNITIVSSIIRHLLQLPRPTINSMIALLCDFHEHSIPSTIYPPYTITYNLLEFANLSIWANRNFPAPQLINTFLPLAPPLSHIHLNSLFCFKEISHYTAGAPNNTAAYLNHMLDYILSITPTNLPIANYHGLTSIKISLYYLFPETLPTLVLSIVRFITIIYPSIIKIVIDRIVVNSTTVRTLIEGLDQYLDEMKARFITIPEITLILHNLSGSQKLCYQTISGPRPPSYPATNFILIAN